MKLRSNTILITGGAGATVQMQPTPASLHIQRGRYRFPNFVRCPAQRMYIEMCVPGSSLNSIARGQ
jgi:hypothetical protein